MKRTEKQEFEALKSPAERAKWLLEKPLTTKPTIDPESLNLTVCAYAAGVRLPGAWDTATEAILGATSYLKQRARLA